VSPWLIGREVRAASVPKHYLEAIVPTLLTLWMIANIWLVAALPMAAVMMAGDGFERSLDPLLILLAAVPASVVMNLLTVLFEVQRRLASIALYLVPATAICMATMFAMVPAYASRGAAVGTALLSVVGQILYIWDQHRQLAVQSNRVWALWATGLGCGVLQVLIGADTIERVGWAVIATIAVGLSARLWRCVDGPFIAQVFPGRLQPAAVLINKLLVAA
jgi:hypothetical protein